MVDVSPSSHPSSTPDFRLYPVDADAKYTRSPSAATLVFYAFYAFYSPPLPLLLTTTATWRTSLPRLS